MLDQSFSASNLRKILDISNRKGVHVEDKVSITPVQKVNEDIRDCNFKIKQKRKAGDFAAVKSLNEKKKKLRELKDVTLAMELEKISANISAKGFRIELKKVVIPGGKSLYTTENLPENYFALKQIQYNILKLFGVKQSNRFAIVEQVINLLSDEFPKFVIRTDIKDFYESILHKPLLERIHKDNLLTPSSRNILTGILKSYKLKSGLDKGIPRGIGISAYLAELYMRDIDNEIRDIDGVTYYARYVDDIIVIFTPSSNEPNRDYLTEIKQIVEHKHNVRLNVAKTQTYDNRTNLVRHNLEFLGYQISFASGNITVKLTSSKVQKFKDRIKSTFDHYINLAKIDEKKARKVLVRRIRFLTGNTRLTNNKKHILIGIYYSNSHLTDLSQISGVDKYLLWHINHRITSAHLKERLKKYTFNDGFVKRRFSPFKTNELSEIMEIWHKKL